MTTHAGPHDMSVGRCLVQGQHAHVDVPVGTLYEEIHHPPHYNVGDIEHCEMVEDQGWADGYYPGQVTKYLYRAGSKPGQASDKDLKKAQWYMNRWMAWRQYGKKIWKIRKVAAEMPFKPDPMAGPADAA